MRGLTSLLPAVMKAYVHRSRLKNQYFVRNGELHYRMWGIREDLWHRMPLPENFYERRRHIFEAYPRITNHDPLSFLLFCKLFDEVIGDKKSAVVLEGGVWRGAFLENLAIHAEERGKQLSIHGVDTFMEFPKNLTDQEGKHIKKKEYLRLIEMNKPFSADMIRERLSRYKSVESIHLHQGDVRELQPVRIPADMAHYDMDIHSAFMPVMRWINDIKRCRIITDDYYSRFSLGLIEAVNDFCLDANMVPVNISDYYGHIRSVRTRCIVLLTARNPD